MMVINGFSRKIPLIDKEGCANQWMQIFGEQVRQLPPLGGAGSPNGVLSAVAGRFYVNQSAGAGLKLWLKAVDAINNDDTQGWEPASSSYYISEQRFQDYTVQEPTALDTPTVVKYGPATTSPNGCVSVDANGVFEVLKGGPYLLKSNLRVSRSGAGGVSHIHLWVEAGVDGINFAPVNVSIRIEVDTSAHDGHLFDSTPVFFPTGTYIRTMQARSSTGTNAGGLFSAYPSASLTTYGVGPDPSASLEWHILTGYDYQ